MNKEIVIIGGVAGGATAAARIRRLDEHANITIFEQGEYISFANCGLPYYVGGDIQKKENLLLQTPEGFKRRYNIDVKVLNQAAEIDKENKRVKVKDLSSGEEYYKEYDVLVLAMGAKPFAIFKEAYTVRNIPDIERVKEKAETAESAVIIGGGYVGLELAENLYKKGLDITIIEKAEHIIASIDKDMAEIVRRYLASKGIKLLLSTGVSAVEGGTVTLENGETINADLVISAIGVRPDVEIVKNAGIEIGSLGGVLVDEYMQTSEKNIYAVGDMVEVTNLVTGDNALIPLASPANKQARIAADNICGIKSKYDGTQGTAIIRIFDMAVASTGAREKLLSSSNIPYLKSYTHSGSHASYYPGSKQMRIKIIWNKENNKLVGAQIVGFEGVDKRIDVLATAIKFGLTPQDLAELELSYAPPFSSAKDPVNMAGYVASNIIDGHMKVFYAEDIEKLNFEEDVLIDVRTKGEYSEGTIEGAVNIPVDELREDRLAEISKDKNIYIFCQAGLRGYLAERILEQQGFEHVKNLSGGYATYMNLY
ncbi:MAG: FAD-dependent oxidoreductase [Firmicutes bacterium]|nr:FAD-dependent oxidoreductase [Bacillota bacterium]